MPSLKQHQSRGYVTFHHSYKTGNNGKPNTTSAATAPEPMLVQQQQQQVSHRPTLRPAHVSKFSSPSSVPTGAIIPPSGGQVSGSNVMRPSTVYVPATVSSRGSAPHYPNSSNMRASTNVVNVAQTMQLSNQPLHVGPPPQYHTVVAATPDPQQQQLAILTSPKSGDPATLYAIVPAGSAPQQTVFDARGNGYIMSTPAAVVQQQPQPQVLTHNVSRGTVPIVPQSQQQQHPQSKSMMYAGVAANMVPIVPSVTAAVPTVMRHPNPSQSSRQSSIYSKPCAVVNAIPTQTTTSQAQQEHGKLKTAAGTGTRSPLSSPPLLKSTPSVVPALGKKGTPTESMSDQQLSNNIQSRIKEKIHEEATTDIRERLKSLNSKYKDFDTVSANDLMDIFDGALKKFQRNSKVYDSYTKQNPNKKIAPPNVQVLPLGEPTPAALMKAKLNSAHTVTTPSTAMALSHSKRPSPYHHPNHYPSTPTGHVDHHHRQSTVVRTPRSTPHQVHSTGVFVPPAAAVNSIEAVPNVPASMYKVRPAPHQQNHHVGHTQHKLQPPKGIPLKQPSNAASKQLQQLSSQSSVVSSYSDSNRSTPDANVSRVVSEKPAESVITANKGSSSGQHGLSKGSSSDSSTPSQQPTGSNSTNTATQKPSGEKRRRKPSTPSNIHQIRTMQQQQQHSAVAAAIASRLSPEKSSKDSMKQQPSTSTAAVMQGSRPPSVPKRVCDKCGKAATFLCSGCHKIWYCGTECQVIEGHYECVNG